MNYFNYLCITNLNNTIMSYPKRKTFIVKYVMEVEIEAYTADEADENANDLYMYNKSNFLNGSKLDHIKMGTTEKRQK